MTGVFMIRPQPLPPPNSPENPEKLPIAQHVPCLQVLEDISIEERLAVTGAGVMREYTVRLRSFPDSKLPKDAQVSFAQVNCCTWNSAGDICYLFQVWITGRGGGCSYQ